MRLTASAPEDLREDCNNLAMCLAFGPSDGNTYNALNWQDTNGNLYAAASFIALDHWIIAASQPLQRPEWDTDNFINMAGAQRAQAAMVVWLGGDDPIPQASPDKLTVVIGDDGLAALAAMGLTMVPTENENGDK